MSIHPDTVTDSNFEQVLAQAEGPVLVDFMASWCIPCQNMLPALTALAEAQGAGFTLVKVDIENAPQTANRFAIRSVPTLMMFEGGEMVRRASGSMSRADIQRFVGASA